MTWTWRGWACAIAAAGGVDVEVVDRAGVREDRAVVVAEQVDAEAGRPRGVLEVVEVHAALGEPPRTSAPRSSSPTAAARPVPQAQPRERRRADPAGAAERDGRRDVLLGLAEARDDVAGEQEVRVEVADDEDVQHGGLGR